MVRQSSLRDKLVVVQLMSAYLHVFFFFPRALTVC